MPARSPEPPAGGRPEDCVNGVHYGEKLIYTRYTRDTRYRAVFHYAHPDYSVQLYVAKIGVEMVNGKPVLKDGKPVKKEGKIFANYCKEKPAAKDIVLPPSIKLELADWCTGMKKRCRKEGVTLLLPEHLRQALKAYATGKQCTIQEAMRGLVNEVLIPIGIKWMVVYQEAAELEARMNSIIDSHPAVRAIFEKYKEETDMPSRVADGEVARLVCNAFNLYDLLKVKNERLRAMKLEDEPPRRRGRSEHAEEATAESAPGTLPPGAAQQP